MDLTFRISLVAAGVLAATGAGCDREKRSPNVVFILADDLGYFQTGCYGSNYYRTANIDRLAAEGIRFTDAYAACSVSSPTRASIMTGKYPARLHLTDFIPGNQNDNYPLSQPEWHKYLPLEEVTLAEMFSGKGYRTAIFGKWHLSKEKFGPESLPFNPDKQGFDQHFVSDKPDRNSDPELDPHKSDSIGNTSVRFIRENSDNPFFLFVSFSAIHNPLMDKADSISWWENVPGSEKDENNPVIAAMLSRLDRNVGKILDALDFSGLASKTIVVFFSDNGGLAGDAKQTPLREGKGWLYEGGIRVPLIIKWPGVIKKGRISKEIVSSVDFMPTFCDLIGSERFPSVDGVSLLDHLKTGRPLPERNIYWHYPHYHNGPPSGAVRSGKWKLIEWYESSILENGKPAYELYNLENDISESVDLAEREKAITLKLADDLRKWREELNAQMPVRNKNALSDIFGFINHHNKQRLSFTYLRD